MLASSRHLPGRSDWVTQCHTRWPCPRTVQMPPRLKTARIHKPLPTDCRFPSQEGFGSLPSGLAGVHSCNKNFSEHAGALADTEKPGLPLRACWEVERLALVNTGLGSNSTPSHWAATSASSEVRNQDVDSPTGFYTTSHSWFTLNLR